MSNKKRIEQEVEKTLKLLEEIEQLELNPFLYTRIRARMKREEDAGIESSAGIKLNSKLIPAFLVVLFLINLYSIFSLYDSFGKTEFTKNRTQYIEKFAEDYMLSQNSYFPITME